MIDSDARIWLAGLLGAPPRDEGRFAAALTHASHGAINYERLEFLGDRVLGLAMAQWLYDLYPNEAEGVLSRRLNQLVAGATCAAIAREVGLPEHIRLGKQARDDGAQDSDNVLGDVVEALIGATYLDGGFDAAQALVRRLWAGHIDTQRNAPRHPKSALQEWAAANKRKPPEYAVTDRSGPHHAPSFTITVSIRGVGEAVGTGASKQEAETAAARALLEQLG